MSKRCKVILWISNILIILSATLIVRNWQQKLIDREINSWAQENGVYFERGYPHWVRKLPNFAKSVYSKFCSEVITLVEIHANDVGEEVDLVGGIGDINYDVRTIDLSPLSKIHTLESLYIVGVEIKNFEALSKIENLTCIILAGSGFQSLESLTSHKNLKELVIHSDSLKDISALKSLKGLKSLSLYTNNNISAAQVNEVCNLLPNCKIEFYGDEVIKKGVEEN